jgi:hypothetical protein
MSLINKIGFRRREFVRIKYGFPRKAEKINEGVRRKVPHSFALS